MRNALKRVWLGLMMVLLLGGTAATAQVVSYRIQGTFDEIDLGKLEDASLFGITASPATFTATLTFNLTAHPRALLIPTGGSFDGSVAAYPFHLFPAASLVSASVSFGTHSWTPSDLVVSTEGSTNYSIISDTDLTSAPTYLRLEFTDESGNRLAIGSASFGDDVILESDLVASDAAQNTAGTGNYTVSAVPEPSTYAAICGALALAGTLVRRRRAAAHL